MATGPRNGDDFSVTATNGNDEDDNVPTEPNAPDSSATERREPRDETAANEAPKAKAETRDESRDRSSKQRVGRNPYIHLKSIYEQRKEAKRAAQASLEFWRAKDEERNHASRMSADERLEYASLWLTDLYGPSTVESLIRGIRSLGWQKVRSRPSDDLIEWIRDSRSRPGQWTSLGFVAPRDGSHFMADHIADLPDGVTGLFPSVHAVSEGMTALQIRFTFDDAAASELQDALTRDYQTYFSALPPVLEGVPWFRRWWRRAFRLRSPTWRSGYTIHDPDHQRRDAANAVRRERRFECSRWMRDHFPGALSQAATKAELPGAELLLTDREEPLTRTTKNFGAFQAAGLSDYFFAWRSDEWPAVRAIFPRDGRDPGSRAITFACRRGDAFRDRAGGDDQSRWAIAYRADDYVHGLAIRWAYSTLLSEHRERLTRLRDASAPLRSSRRPLGDLRQRRRLLATESLDAETASRHIKRVASDEGRFSWDVIELVEAEPPEGRRTRRLLPALRAAQLEQADELVEDLRLVVATLSTDSNLAGIMSNIRLQRLVVLLTVVAVAIAVWAAVQA
jgi:hypothetical protein